ncbi:MAG: BMP family ABC transporter substrate-binding protein [Oscillospiraceae bacterium]|nr:BMP family ABC transporter substrate-binding protein [Oscillospiraceae bacterium]
MKKILALLLAVVMVLSLVACATTEKPDDKAPADNTPADNTPAEQPEETPAEQPEETPAEQPDEAPAESDYAVAMITDYGDITDQSFNQTTYEACKEFCEANGVNFNYFKPAGDNTADRVAMIEKAIDEGYNVIVMPGYAFGEAIKETAESNSDTTFIALDVGAGDLGEDYVVPANLYCAVYQEELCGYMAGYAAVKLGYTKLGFLGGMAVPAVVRYGYGYVQGVDAAAKELDITVDLKYAYGNQFYGDGDITAAMDTWYQGGTEIVFACGGGIYTSAAEAAAKVGGKVIGVDVDQKGIIDGSYGEGMTVTSAMKGLAPTVKHMLSEVLAGNFANYGGKIDTLGLVSANPEENYVQIPTASTQFEDGKFTADDYAALVAAMFDGTVTVSNDTTAMPAVTNVNVEDLGNLK